MLSDLLALCIAFYAIHLAKQRTRSNNLSFGYQRAEILGAFANSVFLLALCFTIIIEAIQRFVNPVVIENPIMVLIVGCVGLSTNILGMVLFGGHVGHDHGHSHSHTHEPKTSHIIVESDAKVETISINIGETPETIDLPAPVLHYSHQTRATIMATADRIRKSSQSSLRIKESHGHSHDKHSHGGHDHSEPHGHSHEHQHHSEHAHAHDHSHGHDHGNMNMHGLFLHVLGDALGSVGVIISSLIIMYANGSWRYYMDPLISLLISALIISSAIPLVRSASFILLQGVPSNVSMDKLRQEISSLAGVLDVHEFHVWGLSDSKNVASVHVRVQDPSSNPPQSYMEIAVAIKRLLHTYGPEFARRRTVASYGGSSDNDVIFIEDDDAGCLLKCEVDCNEQVCWRATGTPPAAENNVNWFKKVAPFRLGKKDSTATAHEDMQSTQGHEQTHSHDGHGHNHEHGHEHGHDHGHDHSQQEELINIMNIEQNLQDTNSRATERHLRSHDHSHTNENHGNQHDLSDVQADHSHDNDHGHGHHH
ncbi:cation efflux protein [Rhizoclosmatium globosum]|uniref:Cation efflux protein n=1 Tax=Rhizoclosmatium globosum TaxID=329046 RepID=A0A1Y2CNY4_9FUNG|nr:cation efflux protein [Rhizoclosmatium globosum]|eukprot:ORY48677.1 cation efflux protein [Rhizoclosmatium globosum]